MDTVFQQMSSGNIKNKVYTVRDDECDDNGNNEKDNEDEAPPAFFGRTDFAWPLFLGYVPQSPPISLLEEWRPLVHPMEKIEKDIYKRSQPPTPANPSYNDSYEE